MDLRGLMGSREVPGQSRGAGGGRKEEMKKGYKKPGAANSTTAARSLRTIQVTITIQYVQSIVS